MEGILGVLILLLILMGVGLIAKKESYHELVVVSASADEVRKQIEAWIASSGFKLNPDSTGARLVAVNHGWHGFGITDRQTGRKMEIIVCAADGTTAVSIYHRTRRFGMLVGVTVGDLLREEVQSLVARLPEEPSGDTT